MDAAAAPRRLKGPAVRLARLAASQALGLLVPPLCLGCRRPLVEARTLCGPCWREVELVAPPICPVMGTPLAFDAGPDARSPELRWNHPLYDRARTATVFGPMSQRLVHALKYHDVPGVADLMARMMAPAVGELTADADILLPMPLHRRRLLARRFNQAALIAASLGPRVGLKVSKLALVRVRSTKPQVGLSREARADNLHRAFAVPDPAAVAGKHVVVVDDVLTTGATADAVAETLKAAGAASVGIAVFARVISDGMREPV